LEYQTFEHLFFKPFLCPLKMWNFKRKSSKFVV